MSASPYEVHSTTWLSASSVGEVIRIANGAGEAQQSPIGVYDVHDLTVSRIKSVVDVAERVKWRSGV